MLGFETFFAREARECASATLRDAGREEWKDPFKSEEHTMLLADLSKIHNRSDIILIFDLDLWRSRSLIFYVYDPFLNYP